MNAINAMHQMGQMWQHVILYLLLLNQCPFVSAYTLSMRGLARTEAVEHTNGGTQSPEWIAIKAR